MLKKRSNTVSSFLYPHSDSDSTGGTPSEVSSQSPGALRHPGTQVQTATAGSGTAAKSGAKESENGGDNRDEEVSGGASAVRLREKGDKRSVSQSPPSRQ